MLSASAGARLGGSLPWQPGSTSRARWHTEPAEGSLQDALV